MLPYSPERFNALLSLGDASAAFAPRKRSVLPPLVALIHAAGLADVAGVALLHAHFTMESEERLVLRAEVRGRLPYPARSAHYSAASPPAHAHARTPARLRAQGLASPQGLGEADVPVMFGCDKQGAVAPLEYCSEHGAHYRASLAAVLSAPGFVADYTRALVALGADGLLGLALLPPASECAPRGVQWLLEEGGHGRSLVTRAFAAGELPVDAVILDGSHDVVWVAPASMDVGVEGAERYATQRKCNVRNTACRDKLIAEAGAEAYATQRKCNVRNTACRDKADQLQLDG